MTSINNELPELRNETFKRNFATLTNLVLVLFTREQTVVPKASHASLRAVGCSFTPTYCRSRRGSAATHRGRLTRALRSFLCDCSSCTSTIG